MATITRRQEKLLRILMNAKDYMSASELAQQLSASEKTVRNEIASIKSSVQYPLIESYKGKGYKIVDRIKGSELLQFSESVPAKRQILILKHILSHKMADFYALADQYYISESTLEKDIKELNKTIMQRYEGLKIQRRSNKLSLEGDEKKKREITTYFLINEIEEYDFNFNNYVSYFKYCNIVDLKQRVLQFLRSEKIQVSDIAMVSLILHLGIMIDRVHSGNFLNKFVKTKVEAVDQSQCERFCDVIEDYIHIELPESERNYLQSIFFSKITVQDENYDEQQKFRSFIDTILEEILEFYQVDLREDNDFKQNLLIHLISLTHRAEQNKYLKNPLIDEIRAHFPLIYDMSVYMSLKIQERLNIRLSEDEIGYISLHLMCVVEKMSLTSEKIILINPNGLSSSRYITQKIHNRISPNIKVETHSYLRVEEIKDGEADLILTTFPLHAEAKIPIYQCSNFITESEIDEINQVLHKENRREMEGLKELEQMFNPNLFFSQLDMKNKDEIIKFLCSALQKEGYTDERYIASVMKRESIAPTAFGGDFAIPHPVEKIALKSGIAVATLKEPVMWGEQSVQMIFMFSLSNDQKNLSKLYEVLVSLLEDVGKVRVLLHTKSYDDFLKLFLSFQ